MAQAFSVVHHFDRRPAPVTAMAVDYDAGHFTDRHQHPHAQLLYAVQGVMRVSTEHSHWIVPPTRGIWVPAGVEHWVSMISQVQMRTAFIRPDARPNLPQSCCVLGITPLLRELLLAAIEVEHPYSDDSRDGRLMQLLLDEISVVPTLPLAIRQPQDARLQQISAALQHAPDDTRTLQDWATQLHIDAKTIQRHFSKETGMTFGQWRQQLRLLAAMERLAAGARILDVALDSGYSSPSAFSTMFKRQFGIAPSEFFR